MIALDIGNSRRSIPNVMTELLGVISFTLLIALGAWVFIPLPFTPVPLTLQTLFVLLSGCLLGRLSKVSILFYALLGVCGWGLFAQGTSGWTTLLGPTGGYLLGFFVASQFLAVQKNRFSTFGRTVFYMGLASILILLMGSLQLALLLKLPPANAMWMGFIPFVPGEFLKVLLAAGIYRATRGFPPPSKG